MKDTKSQVEMEPHRTHEHHGRKYLVSATSNRCWYCGQVLEKDVHPGQLTMDGKVQPQLEGAKW